MAENIKIPIIERYCPPPFPPFRGPFVRRLQYARFYNPARRCSLGVSLHCIIDHLTPVSSGCPRAPPGRPDTSNRSLPRLLLNGTRQFRKPLLQIYGRRACERRTQLGAPCRRVRIGYEEGDLRHRALKLRVRHNILPDASRHPAQRVLLQLTVECVEPLPAHQVDGV